MAQRGRHQINTRYFHNYVKARENKKRINSHEDYNGSPITGESQVCQHIVNHFQSFMNHDNLNVECP